MTTGMILGFGIVGGIVIAAAFVQLVLSKRLTAEQKKMILNYLVYAVVEAEEWYGGGTGKLKLANVYNKFVKQLPQLAQLVSYDTFCSLVDQALEIMKEMCTNDKINSVINPDDKEETKE